MSLTKTKGEERGKSRKIWGLIFRPAEFQVPWYIPMGMSTVQLEMQSGKELSTGERDLAALVNGRLKPSGWVRATQGSPEWEDKGRGGVSGKAGWGSESGEQQQPWGIWALLCAGSVLNTLWALACLILKHLEEPAAFCTRGTGGPEKEFA